MHLFKTLIGTVLIHDNHYYFLKDEWDEIINHEALFQRLSQVISMIEPTSKEQAEEIITRHLLPPIGTQEVWAAGVTYLRSRDARMEESTDEGAADCYQKVYEAERPELFFKALPHRVAGHLQPVFIRKDSTWNVPEPELTLYINSSGTIQAYTIGNDVSSRSIEGENPLYLPQAKVYDRSAALGPCLYVPEEPIPPQTVIHMQIQRHDETMYEASAPISNMKRTLPELAAYLYRECDFPSGCFLMTGTCLVPDNFTLEKGDEITISIDGIGTLINTVDIKKS